VFTRWLANELSAQGYQPDFDQSDRDPDLGIASGELWWPRLKEMIVAADLMVFIVSPESAASRICDDEISFARQMGKRVIPILCRATDYAKMPPSLSASNINIKIMHTNKRRVKNGLIQLMKAIDLDVEWHRKSRHLLELATKWESEHRPERLLISGDVGANEKILKGKPSSANPPSKLVLEFIAASRARQMREIKQRDADLRIQRNLILARQEKNTGILSRADEKLLKKQLELYRGTHSAHDPFRAIKGAFHWHNKAKGRASKGYEKDGT
jgi:hypothetical protein